MASAPIRKVVERCASTNDLARALGEEGAPHGSWVSARVQESGRGRLGRQWRSIEGNLFLSLVVRVEDKSRWTWVSLATAVGVARWLERKHPAVEARIKWPNDLWLVPQGDLARGAKLGGILCEAVGTRSGSFIIVGLGMNCRDAPEGLDQQTTSLTAALGRPIMADDLRDELAESVLVAIDELALRGVSDLVRDFERKAALAAGTPIEWMAPGTESQPGQQGHVRGLGPSGELVVRLADGTEKKLYAEDVKVKAKRQSGA